MTNGKYSYNTSGPYWPRMFVSRKSTCMTLYPLKHICTWKDIDRLTVVPLTWIFDRYFPKNDWCDSLILRKTADSICWWLGYWKFQVKFRILGNWSCHWEVDSCLVLKDFSDEIRWYMLHFLNINLTYMFNENVNI